MAGKFTLARDIERGALDWGEVGSLCNPGETGARQLAIVEARLIPGKGHAFHKHPEQEEVIIVVSGEVEQWIEREKKVLGPGDSAFIPPGIVHASFNVGEGEAHIIAIFGPAVGESGFTTIDVFDEAPWNSLRP